MKSHPGRHRALSRALAALPLVLTLTSASLFAGSWAQVGTNGSAPPYVGIMLLLSNGSVLANTNGDGAGGANGWYLLTPDSSGHYVDGTWTAVSSMHDKRLFFAAQVLPSGKVFIGGGEDPGATSGNGVSSAEIYDPTEDPLNPGHGPTTVSDPWTYISPPTSLLNPAAEAGTNNGNQAFADSTSEVLPNGNVLISPVYPKTWGDTLIYSPSSGWTNGPTLANGESSQDEASWVKLPDNSIITIDPSGQTAERFIPTATGGTGSWVTDTAVPEPIFDSIVGEEGAGSLLPNGKAFFSGGTGNTVLYTPSGSPTVKGSWTKGPVIPQNLAPDDAGDAMMNNGKILCAFSPKSTSSVQNNPGNYPGPTTFFEYDYSVGTTGTFTQVDAPITASTEPGACYTIEMLDLPDGTVLCSNFSSTLYIYTPGANTNSTVSSLVPTVSSISQNSDGTYYLEGTLLNGISEGAAYGDDAQMSTNYPIVSLKNGSTVYYLHTYNWSSTGVRQTGETVSTEFDIPVNVPSGNYSLYVSANGLQSAAYSFSFSRVWVEFGYTGSSNGSFAEPYSTLAAGLSAVASGGTIEIEGGGSSSETPTITQAVNIHVYNGAATIGETSPSTPGSAKIAASEATPVATRVPPPSGAQYTHPHRAPAAGNR